MSNPFFDAFNLSLGEAGRIMGEEWTFDGVTRQAIAIDGLEKGSTVMKGGRHVEVTTTITISLAVYLASGPTAAERVKEGSKVSARGEVLRVVTFGNDGDAARTLVCGPEGFATPGR